MTRNCRPIAILLLLPLAACAGTALQAAHPAKTSVFVGYISESDGGEDHAAMLRTRTMGKTDTECVLKCVGMGAAFGFVDSKRESFYLLDDRQKPRPFAGRRVRLTGRLGGDTIYVQSIEAAE